MLLQMIKHDFKNTWRFFLMLAVLLIGVIIFGSIRNELLSAFVMLFYSILLIVLTMGTVVYMLNYYEKTMFKSQAYLFRSLPVKNWEHLVSKLFVSLVWVVVSIALGLLSAYVLAKINDFFVMEIHGLNKEFLKLIFTGMIELIVFLLAAFLSISIAYMDRFNGHKWLLALIVLVVIGIIQSGMEWVLFVKLFPDVLFNTGVSFTETEFININIWWYVYEFVIIAVLFGLNMYFLKNKSAVENL